ncbi:MAG TPA: XRE family transcriptional regulator [Cyanobacteria bacterium UBA11162]|nr:XRE family transcriptional regulator [Cyanobacteria bacterium UBA11162]
MVQDLSQNKLAVALGVRRSVVYRWYHELTDPTGETVAEIAEALKSINPDAAAEFIRLYVGEFLYDGINPRPFISLPKCSIPKECIS